MNIGISPITGTIFAGKSRKSKNGDYYEWVGKHTDVTNEAIRAVYEWMMFNAKKDNLRAQVEWLCELLGKRCVDIALGEECPPNVLCHGTTNSAQCAACWREAAEKAVKQ